MILYATILSIVLGLLLGALSVLAMIPSIREAVKESLAKDTDPMKAALNPIIVHPSQR